MNNNLNTLFHKIINDAEFTENMVKNKNLRELYEYCLSYVKGYTIEEFIEFLKSIIIINNKISNKVQEMSDEEISNIAGGLNFEISKNKFLAALMSGILLTGCGYNTAANALSANVDETQISLNNENSDLNTELSKIADNLSNNAKQAIQTVSQVAENCLEGAFDFIAPKASAASLGEQQIKTKPTIYKWPIASKVKVGNKVSDSKLCGGHASVSGTFSWIPTIRDETLDTSGTKTYICQFIPDDTDKYTKVTNTLCIEVQRAEKIKPTVYQWPTASKVEVGNKVRDSKLYGGNASVSGTFSWSPMVMNETLNTPGIKAYTCQFTPNDTENYSKVTKTVSIEVKDTMKINWPTASSIEYGQQVGDSQLNYGSSNISGHFEWDKSISNYKPDAGKRQYKVIFKPDDTSNYKETSKYIDLFVYKAGVRIYSSPIASPINYGQSLKDSKISGFSLNVSGKIEWENPSLKPGTGNHTFNVIFTPYDSNYETIIIPITISVNKLTPKLSNTHFNRDYERYLILNDFKLPYGWHWKESYYTSLDRAGKFYFTAVYNEDENHYEQEERVLIEINRISPPTPPDLNITYDKNKSLECINLPEGWNWSNPKEVPNVSKTHYKAYFNAKSCGSKIYKNVSNVNIKINVKKATPKVYSYPIGGNIIYGQSLLNSKISEVNTNVDGYIKWLHPNIEPNAGVQTFNAVFIPYDSNYEKVIIPVTVNVDKSTPILSKTQLSKEYSPNLRLSDFSLPHGWHWENPNCKLDNIGTFKFQAIHDEDSNNYQNNQSVFITINKAQPTLSLPNITYNENTKLKDIKLPKGWHFLDENETPTVSKNHYTARFDANEAQTNFYNSQDEVDVYLNVEKATPKIEKWPETSVEYSENMNDMDLKGISNVPGKFKLIDVPKKIGENLCNAEFIPDSPNYRSLTGKVKIKLLKNMTPKTAPNLNIKSIIKSDKLIKIDIENNNDFLEFSIDNGKTWQDSPEFKDLTPDTTYKIIYRFKETEFQCASEVSNVQEISTKGYYLSKPEKPKSKRRKGHEIILEKNDDFLEFSVDNGKTWQDSPKFKNLNPNTTYKIVCRFKETESKCASEVSNVQEISTKGYYSLKPGKPKVKRRTRHEIILENPNNLLEFSIDNGKTWQSTGVFSNLKGNKNYEFISRFKENEQYMPSLPSNSAKISTRNWLTSLIVNHLLGK